MRSDAEANRARILEVAEKVFTQHGLSVPTEQIASEAGVGIGTLFRHFPQKRDLVEWVLIAHLDRLVLAVRPLSRLADPAEALPILLERVSASAAFKLAMAEYLFENRGLSGPALLSSQALRTEVNQLLINSQRCGVVRQDIDVDVLYLLVRGLARGAGSTDFNTTHSKALEVVLDGLLTLKE